MFLRQMRAAIAIKESNRAENATLHDVDNILLARSDTKKQTTSCAPLVV